MHQLRPGVVRLSTDDLPERDRLPAFFDLYGKTILKHDVEPINDEPFRFTGMLYALPGMGLAALDISSCRAPRRAVHINNNDVVLNITRNGGRTITQRGREVDVAPGEAILTSADPGVATIHKATQCYSLRLSRTILAPMVANLDAALLMTIPKNSIPLRLLTNYIGAVTDADAATEPALRGLVVKHLYDLAALALGAARDAAGTAQDRGVGAARLRAIKNDIAQRIDDPDLSLELVAACHAISPRYVGMLFEKDGTSFSAFVLGERLARAQRLLVDPQQRSRRIADIAYASGFSDLSYFNRSFRRIFGVTPSEMRAADGDTRAGSTERGAIGP